MTTSRCSVELCELDLRRLCASVPLAGRGVDSEAGAGLTVGWSRAGAQISQQRLTQHGRRAAVAEVLEICLRRQDEDSTNARSPGTAPNERCARSRCGLPMKWTCRPCRGSRRRGGSGGSRRGQRGRPLGSSLERLGTAACRPFVRQPCRSHPEGVRRDDDIHLAVHEAPLRLGALLALEARVVGRNGSAIRARESSRARRCARVPA